MFVPCMECSIAFLTISRALSISSSDSLTYTKPLEIISGPETILPEEFIAAVTALYKGGAANA